VLICNTSRAQSHTWLRAPAWFIMTVLLSIYVFCVYCEMRRRCVAVPCSQPYASTRFTEMLRGRSMISDEVHRMRMSYPLNSSANSPIDDRFTAPSTLHHHPPSHFSRPPSHIHCFIPGSKLTFSTNLFHHSLLELTWTAFSDYTGPDLLCSIFFIFS